MKKIKKKNCYSSILRRSGQLSFSKDFPRRWMLFLFLIFVWQVKKKTFLHGNGILQISRFEKEAWSDRKYFDFKEKCNENSESEICWILLIETTWTWQKFERCFSHFSNRFYPTQQLQLLHYGILNIKKYID